MNAGQAIRKAFDTSTRFAKNPTVDMRFLSETAQFIEVEVKHRTTGTYLCIVECDYKDDVLDKHALLGSGGTKCKGFTATNKPCGRKAVCRGYCRGHVEQGVAKQALDNKGVHYSTTTIKKGADEAILNVLSSKLGANVSVENHMVSKSDTFTVV